MLDRFERVREKDLPKGVESMKVGGARLDGRQRLVNALALLGAVFVLPACGALAQSRAQKLDPQLDYSGQLSEPVTYEVEFAAIVTPPYHSEVLRVWLPIPPSDSIQQVTTTELSSYPISVKPQIATEPRYGNKFAYFEFDHPEGAQIIRHKFRVTVHEVRWGIDPEQVAEIDDWPESFEPYLQPVTDTAHSLDFRSLVGSLRADTPSQSIYNAIDWINTNLSYDHVDASLQASADHAWRKRRGHCSDYHGLCQTFGRSLGTPTRVTYGINLFPKNSPSHCKMEAYLAPYGWVSFDVSETQRLISSIQKNEKLSAEEKERLTAAARKRLQTGFRDNTWMLWTRGTHYDLAPKASKPVSVVRTIYAEADGEPLPDPDPANREKREFSWMTVHKYTPSRSVPYPFKDIESLNDW